MRTRLLAAVRALVTDPALKGAGDPARLAAVVLMAKARVAADYGTRITAKELGRWLGLKLSRVAHQVLPELRERGVLGTKETTSATGRVTGLECWVIPMYRAQHGGDRRHALALSRVELIVLLKLTEVLFAPGWEHKDGRTIPAGMLADRTGRGAATDRLALLLLVLSANSQGWLRLCPGGVDTGRGRPAATAGRLLDCSPAAGAKVLSRLQERGVLAVERRATASGLNARSRVRLLPVARAHGVPGVRGREAGEANEAGFPDLADSAPGDHEGQEEAVTPVARAAAGARAAGAGKEEEGSGPPDLTDAAHFHTSHASAVAAVGPLSLSVGFSGEGRGGNRGLPDRAPVREDEGPLRGEQPRRSPASISGGPGHGPTSGSAARAGRQRGRVPAPPQDLRAALAPVDLLWARLERPATRRRVETATRSELARVTGFAGRTDAPQVLAARLARRLEDQLRLGGPIQDPAGWLMGRGLPQRQGCGDVRCDDGTLLDSGRGCPRCEERQADRRAQRRTVATTIEAKMPHASQGERRTATERQLHAEVTARAWIRERGWAEIRERRAATAKARTGAAAPPAAPMPPRPRAEPAPEHEQEQELALEDLTREQVRGWRVRGLKDHRVVLDHMDRYGEGSARRLFSNRLVDQVRRLEGTRFLVLGHAEA
ncbi:hypothetical protein [Streptomyces sp. cg36]|uniref:hypothetical protein n=1 Tax=Streptomyces sp. cg36 TaxID=3238798 RepID=UPI0034E19767